MWILLADSCEDYPDHEQEMAKKDKIDKSKQS